jgi:ribosomal protein S18 acetylase RimI-like enzyme
MRASMADFYRLIGARSPGGKVYEGGGIVASVAPSCPDRSIVNAVVYEDAGGLAAARAEIGRAYERAGVRAWTVWVPESDTATARLLRVAGHVLDGRPRAMSVELADADLDGGGTGLEWERTQDVAALASINEQAYGAPPGTFAAVMEALARSAASVYLARLDGDPAACLVTLQTDGDCGVYLVATAPSGRRRGLALGLMRQALLDAREAGASTSSLQATSAGQPLYARLGYRDLGVIEMWEHRRDP